MLYNKNHSQTHRPKTTPKPASQVLADNWEYVVAGVMVVAGGVLVGTGVGTGVGFNLVFTGVGIGYEKYKTGEVNWGVNILSLFIGLGFAKALSSLSTTLKTLMYTDDAVSLTRLASKPGLVQIGQYSILDVITYTNNLTHKNLTKTINTINNRTQKTINTVRGQTTKTIDVIKTTTTKTMDTIKTGANRALDRVQDKAIAMTRPEVIANGVQGSAQGVLGTITEAAITGDELTVKELAVGATGGYITSRLGSQIDSFRGNFTLNVADSMIETAITTDWSEIDSWNDFIEWGVDKGTFAVIDATGGASSSKFTDVVSSKSGRDSSLWKDLELSARTDTQAELIGTGIKYLYQENLDPVVAETIDELIPDNGAITSDSSSDSSAEDTSFESIPDKNTVDEYTSTEDSSNGDITTENHGNDYGKQNGQDS